MSTDPAPDRVTGTATRDGRTLSGVRAGAGSPTVLLDVGIGASSSAWEPVLARLATHTTVVAYDRVGYGDSGDGDPSPDATLRDIDAVLDAAGTTGSLVLVGHSWGGALARLYVGRHPERVAAVVLVDAPHEAMTLFTGGRAGLRCRACRPAWCAR